MKPQKSFLIQEFYQPDPEAEVTILDLGAYVGGYSAKLSRWCPKATIIAVEPIIENFHHLIQRLHDENLTNVLPIFGAIGGTTRLEKIYTPKIGYKSSFFVKKEFKEFGLPQRTVPIYSWDDLIDMLNIDEVDLAKVNIEGSETELIAGMTKALPRKMVIEEHSKNEITDPKQLIEDIQRLGYHVSDWKLADIYATRI